MATFSHLWNALFRATCLIACVAPLSACGRKGPPKPPEDFAPPPVVSPTLQGSVDGLVLSWTLPEPEEQESDEEPNPPLEKFSIQKGEVIVGGKLRLKEYSTVALKAPEEKLYSFTDAEVEPGKTYQYQILPVNAEGVAGEPGVSLKATFLGENSRIEVLPETSKRPERRIAKDRDEDDIGEQ